MDIFKCHIILDCRKTVINNMKKNTCIINFFMIQDFIKYCLKKLS